MKKKIEYPIIAIAAKKTEDRFIGYNTMSHKYYYLSSHIGASSTGVLQPRILIVYDANDKTFKPGQLIYNESLGLGTVAKHSLNGTQNEMYVNWLSKKAACMVGLEYMQKVIGSSDKNLTPKAWLDETYIKEYCEQINVRKLPRTHIAFKQGFTCKKFMIGHTLREYFNLTKDNGSLLVLKEEETFTRDQLTDIGVKFGFYVASYGNTLEGKDTEIFDKWYEEVYKPKFVKK